jgi:hypothetical protein
MPRCTKPRSSRCIGADGRWPSDSISSTVQGICRSWHHRVRRSLLHAMSARASIQLPSTMNHPAGEPWSSRAYEMKHQASPHPPLAAAARRKHQDQRNCPDDSWLRGYEAPVAARRDGYRRMESAPGHERSGVRRRGPQRVQVPVLVAGQRGGEDLVGGCRPPGRCEGSAVEGQGGSPADPGIGEDAPARIEGDEPGPGLWCQVVAGTAVSCRCAPCSPPAVDRAARFDRRVRHAGDAVRLVSLHRVQRGRQDARTGRSPSSSP